MGSRTVLVVLIIVVVALSVGTGVIQNTALASPAVGDQIHQIQVPVPGAPNFCSIGLAFDGSFLYYDRCGDPNIYKIDPISGSLQDAFDTSTTLTPIIELPNALAFDRTRNGMWIGTQRSLGVSSGFGCGFPNNGMPIYFWDFDDDTVTLVFTIPATLINPATGQSFLGFCFADGLAFDANDPTDPNDDEIWFSDDVNRNVGVFKTNGTFLRGYDVGTVDPSLGSTSGIAVGGQFLYLANDGGGDVFRADKLTDPLARVDQFTSGDTRQEDMECDPSTFAPTEVMWVRTTPQGGQFPDVITAYEIEPGSCGLGGAPIDTDGDGLFDDWEINGFDFDGDGNVDIDLPSMGADHTRKDIFVEIDWMEEPGILGHSHRPNPDAIQMIIDSFANAPVDCKPLVPDDCKGIALHVDFGDTSLGQFSEGEAVPHQDILGSLTSNGLYDWTDFDAIKDQHFSPARAPIFHYAIFAHSIVSLCGWSGISRDIPSSDFIVALGGWRRIIFPDVGDPDVDQCLPDPIIGARLTGSRDQQAGTFMHELGHNLNLQHGGIDGINNKPNYLSVMNYMFQTRGLIINGQEGNFDYSRFFLGVPTLDEQNLGEPFGLIGGGISQGYGTRQFNCDENDPLYIAVLDANGPIDWDCDGTIDQGTVQSNVNGDSFGNGTFRDDEQLRTHLDWVNLKYDGGLIGLGISGELPMATVINEMTPEDAARIQPVNRPPTADAGADQTVEWTTGGAEVTLDGSGSSDPDGDELTYTWTGPFSEGGGTVTGANPTVTLLSLGDHIITLVVNDGTVDSEPDTVTITVQDTTAPDVIAALVPVGEVDDDEGRFHVEYSCSDSCDTNPEVTGVITTPSLDGLEVKLKTGRRAQVEFDLEDGEVEIRGPDPEALLAQLQEHGGFLVSSGQLVEVELEDDDEDEYSFRFGRDGTLNIEAPSIELVVTCKDASGNEATATATPSFAEEGDDDDEDEDDDDDDEDEDDGDSDDDEDDDDDDDD